MIGPGTDAYLLRLFLREQPPTVALGDIGLYSIGTTFGLGLKLFLSAFEYAWAPFYFATMKEEDAKQAFSVLTTYSVGVLVLLTTGLSAVATDLVKLMTKPEFYGAARVIPWIAMGVTLQGVYLLTSIGLNITKHTEYYPLATGITAAVNVGSNLLLIPRFGIMGPAWSNTISYGVLAGIAMWFSQRFYPIRYEWGRLLRIVLAGVAAYLLATLAVPYAGSAILGVLVRGAIVTVGFPAGLAVTGFFEPREVARLSKLVAQLRRGRGI